MEDGVDVFANWVAKRAGPWRSVIVNDIDVMCVCIRFRSIKLQEDDVWFGGDGVVEWVCLLGC